MKKMIVKSICVVALLLILAFISMVIAVAVTGRKKIEPYIDSSGQALSSSIAERAYIDVNGRKNGMIIRGKNVDNPVLLFISGGPGVPQYWLNDSYKDKYPNHIEDEFTVCWWDYRGEGLSYDKDIRPEEITLDQLTEDAVCVAEYLKERFGKDKIYLMAHSGGTMLGMNLAVNKPEYFYCYFAMGQVTNPGYDRHESGYEYMKDLFSSNGEKRKLKKLESLVEERDGHIRLKPKYHDGHWEGMLLSAGCATTREMRSDAFGIFFPQMLSHCYSFSEKIDYWKGKALLAKSPYMEESNRVYEKIESQIPIIYISGTYDYTTPITHVKELYDRTESEGKAFCEFMNSAHSPLWEENDKVLEVMKSYVR